MIDIIGKEFKVLDQGYIKVIDYMGNDQAIVDAARVSYQKGTKSISDNRNLIRYLMRMGHHTPFEMCSIKFNIKMPVYCMRQLIRHRTAKTNEISGRYSILEDHVQETNYKEWRIQSQNNKQGSNGYLLDEIGNDLSIKEKLFHKLAREIYEERLNKGVAREQARKDLPLSIYTQFIWKMDLRNLLHFLELRMNEYAQLEIRSYANIIGNEIVSKLFSQTWEAFCDYRLNSINLSALEINIIKTAQLWWFSKEDNDKVKKLLEDYGWTTKSREYIELQEKLNKLNLGSII